MFSNHDGLTIGSRFLMNIINKFISIGLLQILLMASTWAFPTLETEKLSKNVPLADVHFHIEGKTHPPLEWYRDKLKNNNVNWAGAVGNYEPGMSESMGKNWIPAFGQREFFLTYRELGVSGIQDLNSPKITTMFNKAERLFEQGKITGFGEIHSDNHSSGPPQNRRQIKISSPVIEKMFELANKHNGFVQLHAEYSNDLESDLKVLINKYPNTEVVLAHCLSTDSPDLVEKIFSISSKISCEISATGSWHINKVSQGRSSFGHIYGPRGPSSKWIEFINKYSNRVMIGSDACCGWEEDYDAMIKEIRANFLPYFSPEVIEKLAYKNAISIFKIKTPKKESSAVKNAS